ncbi:MAG: glucose 1-dehydrogenase [Acidimicrobiales bacterium]
MGVLDGMVAIVTGAARGQGEAEARLLVANGARVVLTDILTEQGRAVAADLGGEARFVTHDVSSEAGWREVIEAATGTFGRVDILVNNAAISKPLKLVDTEPDVFDQIYRVNQLGVFLGMRAVVEPMRAAGRGSIINISSVAGLRGTSTLFAYTATKWAVRGMSRSAALELARYNIRVNVIFPGVIDTPMNDDNPAAMNEVLVKTTPMRRMGEPDEIAQAVLFLASPSSSFATGAELAIDGGMSI